MKRKKLLANIILYILTFVITILWGLAILGIIKPIAITIASIIYAIEVADLNEFLND